MHERRALGLFVVVLFLASSVSSATVLEVCGTCNYTSIAEAVKAAPAGATILVEAATYTEIEPVTTHGLLTLNFTGPTLVNGPSFGPWLRINSTVVIYGQLHLVGALELGSRGRLDQWDNLTVEPPSAFLSNSTDWLSNKVFGVAVAGAGVWRQIGFANVTVVSQSPAQGVISQQETQTGGTWLQFGDAHIQVESILQVEGVYLGQAMQWTQSGAIEINVVSTQNSAATAVYLELNSTWTHNQEATMSATSLLAATGVGIFGGEWDQNAPARLTISAPKASAIGVQVTLDSISGTQGGTWSQGDALNITWVGSTGSGFQCKERGTWECFTDDLSGLLGDPAVDIAETGPHQCEVALAYVPEVPDNFAIKCNTSYGVNDFWLPEDVTSFLGAQCGNVTTLPVVSFYDDSPLTMARTVVYEFVVINEDPTVSVNFTFRLSDSKGFLTFSNNVINASLANTTISVQSNLTGAGNGSLELMPSIRSFALTKFEIPVTFISLALLRSITSAKIALELGFNISAPIISMNPVNDSIGQDVVFSLSEINEVASNGTVVRTTSVTQGEWGIVPTDDVGAAQTFRFSSSALFPDTNLTTKFGMRWYLFDRATNVSVPSVVSNQTLLASPQFAKTTLYILPSWPWLSANNTLRLLMKVSPAFESFTVQKDTPEAGVTSYTLSMVGSDGVPQTVVVRLLGAGAVHNPVNGTISRVAVDHWANATKSEVVLSFAYFNGLLAYDPDISVLLGSTGGSSSSNNALIIAVAVAVPVAVVLVVTVIVVALVVGWWAKSRSGRSGLQAVNITAEDMDGGL